MIIRRFLLLSSLFTTFLHADEYRIADSGDFIAVSQLKDKKPLQVFMVRKVNIRDVEVDLVKSSKAKPGKMFAAIRITMKPHDGYPNGRAYITKWDMDTETVHEAFLRISEILGKKMSQKSIQAIDNKATEPAADAAPGS